METIRWSETEEYAFICKSSDTRPNGKRLLYGEFDGSAPAGLLPDFPYCLKISKSSSEESRSPQAREHYDLMDYEGKHLRTVLARNDAAQRVCDSLDRWGKPVDEPVCISVEPWYESTVPILTRCSELTEYERLEIVRQFAAGVCELHRNTICSKQIIAHRDLKLSNGVIQKSPESFTIFLIDMASIRLEAEPSPTGTRVAGSGTAAVTPMSADNTSPELVDLPGCRVGRTTDVYSLGMLLASLFFMEDDFSHQNPNALWLNTIGWGSHDFGPIKQGFREAMEVDSRITHYDPDVGSWLEQALEKVGKKQGKTFTWDRKAYRNYPELMPQIRELFFKATRILPEDRIGPEEFLEQIERLITKTAHICSGENVLYLTKSPLTVLLFDENCLDRYRAAYLAAAQDVLNQEYSAYDHTPMKALCFSFRDWLPEEQGGADLKALVQYIGLLGEDELKPRIRTIPAVNDADKINRLTVALFSVYRHLVQNAAWESFNGAIHLFSPVAPAKDSLGAMCLGDNTYTIDNLLGPDGLGDLSECAVTLTVHCPAAEESYCEDWYTMVPLDNPIAAKLGRKKRPTRTPVPLPKKETPDEEKGEYFYYGKNNEIHYI